MHAKWIASLSILLGGLLPTVDAATITWSGAQDTTSVADISSNGASVGAFNGGQTTVTAGGVTFVNANPFGFASLSGFSSGNTGDVAFNQLLASASFSPASGNPGTIDLGSFTPGSLYEVQVFFLDQRPAQNDRTNRIGSIDTGGPGATVDLESDPNNDLTAPFGQFAIGTFTADGDDPDLTVFGTDFASAQINAWQVRLVVPEPASLVGLLMTCGLMATHRRR